MFPWVVLCLLPFLSAEFLYVRTTYEAEDFGIATDEHEQCRAWKLWWRTQETNTDLTTSDIDLLAIRRSEVWVNHPAQAARFDIPLELLQQFSNIYVDFENVCRLHPRNLRIQSAISAIRYGFNVAQVCEELSGNSTNEDRSFLLNTTASLFVFTSRNLLENHESVSLNLEKVCDPQAEEDRESHLQYYQEKYGSFVFNVSALEMDIEELRAVMKNTVAIDEILRKFEHISESAIRPYPSSAILPFLKKVHYDSRIPPILHVGDQLVVKFGLLIQSMSNFELSTMAGNLETNKIIFFFEDYDVDTWVRMAWIDPRLRHQLSRPILVNDYTFLRLIWRPDPIFTNAKLSTFHKVSYFNFYMIIFPGGEVFMDIRVYLKPTAAQIVLCKYPHDNPAATLKISSLGLTKDVVSFEWFSALEDAIRINADVQIPELHITSVAAGQCDGTRKSGNYSCLESVFYMKRHIGYHIANTYIPTAFCVAFSWISVWLPEEFVEGRIFVSLTVFLTLSAENNSAKEELPKVSYIKAIDIWFGFTSIFVFSTMIQALVVISLEHNSRKLKTKSENNLEGYSKFQITKSLLMSRYYHKLARQIDTFCKVMYPVTFLLFLMVYVFVITEGDERKCLQSTTAIIKAADRGSLAQNGIISDCWCARPLLGLTFHRTLASESTVGVSASPVYLSPRYCSSASPRRLRQPFACNEDFVGRSSVDSGCARQIRTSNHSCFDVIL
ncbi:unnamed protein product [Caenorhabditis auriculariae]|uniref:Uncharacterized protein n=1 Tax=Caenorhabditis auriculariae TaxID=2777116 RepID=A0A8S1HPC4_9PELO|nr:unnamed protein product [Caenorhabditis auriculariae]